MYERGGVGGAPCEGGCLPFGLPPLKKDPYLKGALLGSAERTPIRGMPLKSATSGGGLRSGGVGAKLKGGTVYTERSNTDDPPLRLLQS